MDGMMTPLIADAPWLRTADGLILFLGAVSKDQGATVLGHRQAHAASRRYRRYAVRPMLPLAVTDVTPSGPCYLSRRRKV